jgi:ATP-dependent protease ClpP protease subunit
MGSPHPHYRENSSRCIYVTGTINQELVNRLSPIINKFRLTSSDPVTVYIDSLGGSMAAADTIQNLVKAPNPDGQRCRMITVSTGTAASAAADLLALGDYAIAYPHSSIFYHGVRESRDEAITSELATRIANSLQQTNEFAAVRLARRGFERFVFRLSQLNEDFQNYVSKPSILTLITAFRGNERFSFQNSTLLRTALAKQHTINNLTASVARQLRAFKRELSTMEFEVEIFKGILKHKLKAHKEEPWLLSTTGLQEVTNDFTLLHDFHFGSQRKDLLGLIEFLVFYS